MKPFLSFVFFFFLTLAVSAQNKIKVACVGNSITEGAGITAGQNYPQHLQALLGENYEVKNYGVSGRTLLKKGDFPYWNEAKYREVLQWQPDVVVIKLGTNDTKPQNWQHKDDFKNDYIQLIKSFKKLPSQPKVFICKPMPAYYTNFNISPEIVQQEILPLIERIAKKTKVRVIDLYEPMVGKNALAPDGIHPNSEGAAILAQEVYKAIKK